MTLPSVFVAKGCEKVPFSAIRGGALKALE